MAMLNTRVTDLEPSDLGTGNTNNTSNNFEEYDVYGNTKVEIATSEGSRQLALSQLRQLILGDMYPVGSIYQTTDPTNPNKILGFGTWRLYGTNAALFGYDQNDSAFTMSENVRGNTPDDMWVNNSHWGWYHLTTRNFPNSGHTHPFVNDKGESTVSSKWVRISNNKESEAKDLKIAMRSGYGLLTSNNIIKNKILSKRDLGETNVNITSTSEGDPYKTTLTVRKNSSEEYKKTKESTDIKSEDMKYVVYNGSTYIFTIVPEMKGDDPKDGFNNTSKWIKVVARRQQDLGTNLGQIVDPSDNWNKSDKNSKCYNPLSSPCTYNDKIKVKGNNNLLTMTASNIGDYVTYTDSNGALNIYVYCEDEEVRTISGNIINNITNNTNIYNIPSDNSKIYEVYGMTKISDYIYEISSDPICTLSAGTKPNDAVHIVPSLPSNGTTNHIYIRTTDLREYVKTYTGYREICIAQGSDKNKIVNISQPPSKRVTKNQVYVGALYFVVKNKTKKQDTKDVEDGKTVKKTVNQLFDITKLPSGVVDAIGKVTKVGETEIAATIGNESIKYNEVTGDVESIPKKDTTKSTYRIKVRKWVPYVSAFENTYLGRVDNAYSNIKDNPTERRIAISSQGKYYNPDEPSTFTTFISANEGDIAAYNWFVNTTDLTTRYPKGTHMEWKCGEYVFKMVEDNKITTIENADGTITYKTYTKTKSKWVSEDTGSEWLDTASGSKDDDTRRDMVYPSPFGNDDLSKKISQIKLSRNSSDKIIDTGIVFRSVNDDPNEGDTWTASYLEYGMLFWPGAGYSAETKLAIDNAITGISAYNPNGSYRNPSSGPSASAINALRTLSAMTEYVTDKTQRSTDLFPKYSNTVSNSDDVKEWDEHTPDFNNGYTQETSHTDGTIINLLPEYVVTYRWVRTA